MPANLTPEYKNAEARYRSAKTAEEKVAALKYMMASVPKHKGTEKIRADIKKKLSQLRNTISNDRIEINQNTILVCFESDDEKEKYLSSKSIVSELDIYTLAFTTIESIVYIDGINNAKSVILALDMSNFDFLENIENLISEFSSNAISLSKINDESSDSVDFTILAIIDSSEDSYSNFEILKDAYGNEFSINSIDRMSLTHHDLHIMLLKLT